MAIWSGLRLATEHDLGKKTIIFVDNHVAIYTCSNPRNKSAQTYVKRIINALNGLRETGGDAELQWIPSHENVAGNEHVDLLAKMATGWRPEDKDRNTIRAKPAPVLPRLVQLRSAITRQIKQHIKARWANAI